MSSFKRPAAERVVVDDQPLGILHASFKWNEQEESRETSVYTSTRPESNDSQSLSEERLFELRDIDIIFPEGELTLVVGPSTPYTHGYTMK